MHPEGLYSVCFKLPETVKISSGLGCSTPGIFEQSPLLILSLVFFKIKLM